MAQSKAIKAETKSLLLLDGQEVEWRLLLSPAAKRLRIKVGPDGIVVVLPEGRDSQEADSFVADNSAWISEQLSRTRKLLAVRRSKDGINGRIPYRGEDVAVQVAYPAGWSGPNRLNYESGILTIRCGKKSRTAPPRSLENWLRKQAREQIEQHVADVGIRLKRTPNRIYVMGQRTKWGNCSALGNLSFNWRLILAPDAVLRYIVIHEMVHLVVPDHSKRFWLTVQSVCPDYERARQWLVAYGHQTLVTDISRAPAHVGKVA